MKKLEIVKKEYGLFDIIVDGQAVGGGSMMEDDDSCYLERLDIDPEHQGKGYGTQTLYQLSEVYGTYYLAPDNPDAKRLYDRVADEISQADYDSWGFAVDQGHGVYIVR